MGGSPAAVVAAAAMAAESGGEDRVAAAVLPDEVEGGLELVGSAGQQQLELQPSPQKQAAAWQQQSLHRHLKPRVRGGSAPAQQRQQQQQQQQQQSWLQVQPAGGIRVAADVERPTVRAASEGGSSGEEQAAGGEEGKVAAAGAPNAALKSGPWTNAGGFAAMSARSPGVPAAPPLDASAAVGGGKAVAVANSVVQIYDAASGGLDRAVRLSALFSPVVIEFAQHNVQRSPAVIFDRSNPSPDGPSSPGGGRFILAATSYDTAFKDASLPGRLLLAVTSDANPLNLWRVVSVPSPPCEAPGLYAQPDAPALSYDQNGVFVGLTVKCHDPQTQKLRSTVSRLVAFDRVGGWGAGAGTRGKTLSIC
jgi:hypothetical protein